ncbi:hypothetical protein ES703_35934 [subsurface metagenome]
MPLWQMRTDEDRAVSLHILAAYPPILTGEIDNIRVHRVRHRVTAVASGPGIEPDVFPSIMIDGIPLSGRAIHRRIILNPAIDIIGILVIQGNVIKLPGRDVVVMHPGISFVITDIETSVIAKSKVVGIERVDPHLTMVEVQCFGSIRKEMEHISMDDLKCLAAIFTPGRPHTQGEDFFIILRVHIAVGKIPSDAREDIEVVFMGSDPVLTAIQGPVDFCGNIPVLIQVVHKGIGFIRIGPRDSQADAASLRAGWKTAFHAIPGLSAVRAFVDSGLLSVYCGIVFPHGDINNIRIGGSDNHIIGPGALVHIQNVIPRFSTVYCPVEASVRVG